MRLERVLHLAPRLGLGKSREVIRFTRNCAIGGNAKSGSGANEVSVHG